jgi:hypothetical protein
MDKKEKATLLTTSSYSNHRIETTMEVSSNNNKYTELPLTEEASSMA